MLYPLCAGASEISFADTHKVGGRWRDPLGQYGAPGVPFLFSGHVSADFEFVWRAGRAGRRLSSASGALRGRGAREALRRRVSDPVPDGQVWHPPTSVGPDASAARHREPRHGNNARGWHCACWATDTPE